MEISAGLGRVQTFLFNTGGASFLPDFAPIPDAWNHIVFVWDASVGRARIYANNVLKVDQSGLAALLTSNNRLKIGGGVGDVIHSTFDGLIDEIGFWIGLLSAADVSTLYNGGAALALGSPNFPT